MAAALIGSLSKEEIIKVRVDIPEGLYEELKIYSYYVGGKEEDIPEVINKVIEYVLEKESKGKQGKKFKEFKEEFLRNMNQNTDKDVSEIEGNISEYKIE